MKRLSLALLSVILLAGCGGAKRLFTESAEAMRPSTTTSTQNATPSHAGMLFSPPVLSLVTANADYGIKTMGGVIWPEGVRDADYTGPWNPRSDAPGVATVRDTGSWCPHDKLNAWCRIKSHVYVAFNGVGVANISVSDRKANISSFRATMTEVDVAIDLRSILAPSTAAYYEILAGSQASNPAVPCAAPYPAVRGGPIVPPVDDTGLIGSCTGWVPLAQPLTSMTKYPSVIDWFGEPGYKDLTVSVFDHANKLVATATVAPTIIAGRVNTVTITPK